MVFNPIGKSNEEVSAFLNAHLRKDNMERSPFYGELDNAECPKHGKKLDKNGRCKLCKYIEIPEEILDIKAELEKVSGVNVHKIWTDSGWGYIDLWRRYWHLEYKYRLAEISIKVDRHYYGRLFIYNPTLKNPIEIREKLEKLVFK